MRRPRVQRLVDRAIVEPARHNLLTYGLGGMLLPFPAIEAIDLALTALGWG